MSFLHKALEVGQDTMGPLGKIDPAAKELVSLTKPSTPPKPPGPPNQNDAANAAQATTDQARQRRGMLANIYAGASNAAPVTGSAQLGR